MLSATTPRGVGYRSGMRRTKSSRVAILVAAAAAVLLSLSACSTVTLTPRDSAAPTPSSGANPALGGLDEFYGQTISWARCETGTLECATIQAPIDYADPSAGSTPIAMIRKPASGKALGSLFMNPGGPGGSGFDLIAQSVEYVADESLQKNYDIVGWDPRGVGRSAPVTCLDSRQLDGYLYGVSENPSGSDGWFNEKAEAARGFADACERKAGTLLGHIDAASTARDLDLMRALVGDAKLNYLGFSYGTMFGGQYAELFPQNVGRVVLDGAIDPTLTVSEIYVAQMAGFEGAFRAFLSYCLTKSACPFDGTVDNAGSQASALFAAIEPRKLVAGDGRTLSAGTLGTALAYPLYDRGAWDQLIVMLNDLVAGNPNSSFASADAYNERSADGSYASNAAQVYTAALCVDGTYSSDLAGTKATLAAIEAAAPIIGSYIAYSDWVVVDTACQVWPVKSERAPAPVTGAGAAPILVLSTTNDPATPYQWGVALASQLESGVLVTRNGEGHTAYARGNACIDTTVDAYFVDGKVPVNDPRC